MERDIVELIVGYLEDPMINPYGGSVPFERSPPCIFGTKDTRVQNIVFVRNPDVYRRMGTQKNAWLKFLSRNRTGSLSRALMCFC